MTLPLNEKYSQIYGWAGATFAALIFLELSWDTTLHQFAIGLATALIVLFVLMVLLEGIWRVGVYALRRVGFEIEI